MSVFFMAEITEISNDKLYSEYVEKATPIIAKYGGEYIFRSQRFDPVSGDWDLKRIILIRFASRDKVRECFQSEEYQEIAYLRGRSTVSKAILIEE